MSRFSESEVWCLLQMTSVNSFFSFKFFCGGVEFLYFYSIIWNSSFGVWQHIIQYKPMYFSFLFKISYYDSLIALQCHFSFCRTAKWIFSPHICLSFLDLLPIQLTMELWTQCPVWYSRFSLVTYFTHHQQCGLPRQRWQYRTWCQCRR